MVNSSSNELIAQGEMTSSLHFHVHTSLLAMKSTGPNEKYITLFTGTVGEVMDPEKLNHPGLVKIRVKGESLYTFTRDLQHNAFIEPLQPF